MVSMSYLDSFITHTIQLDFEMSREKDFINKSFHFCI